MGAQIEAQIEARRLQDRNLGLTSTGTKNTLDVKPVALCYHTPTMEGGCRKCRGHIRDVLVLTENTGRSCGSRVNSLNILHLRDLPDVQMGFPA